MEQGRWSSRPDRAIHSKEGEVFRRLIELCNEEVE
jgi:hypothetical protein